MSDNDCKNEMESFSKCLQDMLDININSDDILDLCFSLPFSSSTTLSILVAPTSIPTCITNM